MVTFILKLPIVSALGDIPKDPIKRTHENPQWDKEKDEIYARSSCMHSHL
jgi:hypothetical protein